MSENAGTSVALSPESQAALPTANVPAVVQSAPATVHVMLLPTGFFGNLRFARIVLQQSATFDKLLAEIEALKAAVTPRDKLKHLVEIEYALLDIYEVFVTINASSVVTIDDVQEAAAIKGVKFERFITIVEEVLPIFLELARHFGK